jgi:type II secretion system-associated lipoprotein
MLALGLFNCQKRIFKKEEVYHLNEYYKNKTYFLKDNLTISNKRFSKRELLLKFG